MYDQYTPIPTSREVRELRRELQAAREEIDRLQDQIRDLESDLCLSQPRMPRRNTIREFVIDRMAHMPDASHTEVAIKLGTTAATIDRIVAAAKRIEQTEDV